MTAYPHFHYDHTRVIAPGAAEATPAGPDTTSGIVWKLRNRHEDGEGEHFDSLLVLSVASGGALEDYQYKAVFWNRTANAWVTYGYGTLLNGRPTVIPWPYEGAYVAILRNNVLTTAGHTLYCKPKLTGALGLASTGTIVNAVIPEGSDNPWIAVQTFTATGANAEPPLTGSFVDLLGPAPTFTPGPGYYVELRARFSAFAGTVPATQVRIQVWVEDTGGNILKVWNRIYDTADLTKSESDSGIWPVFIPVSSLSVCTTMTFLDGTSPNATGLLLMRRVASVGLQRSDMLFNQDTGHQLVETRGYDEASDAERVLESAPDYIASAPETLWSHTNLASSTVNYYKSMQYVRRALIQMNLDAVSTVTIWASNDSNSDPTVIAANSWTDITALFGDVDFVSGDFILDTQGIRPWWLRFQVVVSNNANASFAYLQESN